jgi:hypothetical protein
VTALFGGDGANAPAKSKTYHVRVPRKGGSTSGEPEPPPPYSDPSGGTPAR